MADEKLLSAALSEFARTLVKRFAISDVLDDLAQRVTLVLGIAGAGVSLREGDRLRFVTAVDERTTNLERIQEREQAGPCIDAWRSGEVVTVADLRATAGAWRAYGQAARAAGIVAVAGVPMSVERTVIGALDLYDARVNEWDRDDLAAARVLADMATSYVVNASELDRQRRTTEQLQEALDSRIVIEQAKGIIAAERGVSVDEAFEVLRRHARSRNTHLRAVADAVVNLGLRP
jgi:transcriptional regulator with GAF, ATPase, and Fis domain